MVGVKNLNIDKIRMLVNAKMSQEDSARIMNSSLNTPATMQMPILKKGIFL